MLEMALIQMELKHIRRKQKNILNMLQRIQELTTMVIYS